MKKAVQMLEAATLPIETLIDRNPEAQRARQDLIVLLYKLWKITLHAGDAARATIHRQTALRLIAELERTRNPLPEAVAQAKAKFHEKPAAS